MAFSALWFGPADRPLFGRLYVPDGDNARAGIVLCPPLGLEGTCAGRTYQILAERLADQGLAVLHIDYDATGDSSGSGDEDDRVGSWKASIRAGIELLRSGGAQSVAAVGMRMGATLLATVAAPADLDAIVLWDLCDSGRSYLREQLALRAVHLGDETLQRGPEAQLPEGSIEVLGAVFSAHTSTELSAVSISSTEGRLARRVLVLTRSQRSPARAVTERMSAEDAEWEEADGQEELIGVRPGLAQVPEDTVETICKWLSDTLGTERLRFVLPANARAVVEDDGQAQISEEIVSIGSLGLFGILTTPATTRAAVTIVFLNAGVINHVGPARLWVLLARSWAKEGFECLRVDLSGLGDSPVRPDQQKDVMYPPEVFDDLEDITKAVSPADPKATVLVGLCSGGYHSVEGGIALGTRGICVINPILPRNPLNQPGRSLEPRPPEPRRQATAARKSWVQKLPAHDRLAAVADKLPGAAWWVFDRIGVELPPARALQRVVQRGVDTFVVCGPREARVIQRGEGGILRRLRRSGRFELRVVPGIDHELLQPAARELVAPMLTRHLERYVEARSAP